MRGDVNPGNALAVASLFERAPRSAFAETNDDNARTGASIADASNLSACASRSNKKFRYPLTYIHPHTTPPACPKKDTPGIINCMRTSKANGYHSLATSNNPNTLLRPTSV